MKELNYIDDKIVNGRGRCVLIPIVMEAKMTKNDKPFMVLEAVKELAQLRADLIQAESDRDTAEGIMIKTPGWKNFEKAVDKMGDLMKALSSVEAAFKAGCENIFEETEEKKFPGGQIKMRTTFEYSGNKAVDWAIKHKHPELLSIVKGEFKKICRQLKPDFVTKIEAGKMYIDSDLSQYLEDE